ncbi:hypothetical protein P7C73_g4940, partial [Tremellales sp. Uapishka_1]
MLRNLTSAGIISTPRTPELAVVDSKPKLKNGVEAYEDMILSLDVNLASLDLNQLIASSRMHTIPTSHIPTRCKQCGMRFPLGDEAKLQSHMDWHFRRNRKERESEGRGAHRRWLPRAEEWVTDLPDSSPGAGPSSPSKPAAAKLTAEKLASLAKRWVRVPQDARKDKPCPICKEMFKAEWSQEEEEWIFSNAIEVSGNIYHATCRAESINSAMANRLKEQSGLAMRRSMSKSPAGSVVDLPKVDEKEKKRKAEEEEGENKRLKVGEGQGSDQAEVVVKEEKTQVEEKGEESVSVDRAGDVAMDPPSVLEQRDRDEEDPKDGEQMADGDGAGVVVQSALPAVEEREHDSAVKVEIVEEVQV